MARIVFMGTPDFAVPTLRALIAHHEVVGVVTQPDRPAGRRSVLTPPPIKGVALDHGIDVFQPEKLRKADAIATLKRWEDIDVYVVAAFGQILPQSVLDIPRLGSINVHASLLPRWRGAAPIQAAILAGDDRTGVTIMRMDEGLDTGPMLLAEAVPIGPETTASTLHDTLAVLGARLILRALAEDPPAVPQPDEGVTYAPKLTREDGRIDWSRDAAAIDRQVRALNPWPGTHTRHGDEALKVLGAAPLPERTEAPPGTVLDGGRVACGGGTVLRLTRLQRAGRASQDIDAFLRGYPLAPGDRLG